MNFSIPETTQALLKQIRDFVDAELIPLEAQFIDQSWDTIEPTLREKREKVKALDLWAPGHPVSVGGKGYDLVTLGLISEELGRTPTGHYVFGCQAPDAGNIELLEKHASAAQRDKYLHPLANGEIRSCFAMTEPHTAGSNPVLIDTLAERDGDDYVINGHKWFTTSADGAEFAIVMAVTKPDGHPYQKASMIIVPTDTPGYNFIRNIPVMGHAGGGYASHAEIKFENCRVPATNLIGPEGAGFILAQERLGPGRIHHCMRWLGICQRANELMVARLNSRKVSSNKVLGDMQAMQFWVAESAAEIEAARTMVLKAAWTIENQGFKDARDQVSMIKFYVADILQKVVDRALQTHGALGMTDDTILAFYYREERAARIYDGADEVHKMSLAKRILAANK